MVKRFVIFAALVLTACGGEHPTSPGNSSPPKCNPSLERCPDIP